MLISLRYINFLLNGLDWGKFFSMLHRTNHLLHEIFFIRHISRNFLLELLNCSSLLWRSQHRIDELQYLIFLNELSILLCCYLIVNNLAQIKSTHKSHTQHLNVKLLPVNLSLNFFNTSSATLPEDSSWCTSLVHA